MRKRLLLISATLLLMLLLIPANVFAASDAKHIAVVQDDYYGNVGDTVQLGIYTWDADWNDVVPGSSFTFKWYSKDSYDYSDNKGDLLGEGKTLNLKVTEKCLREKGYTIYVVMYKNGEEIDSAPCWCNSTDSLYLSTPQTVSAVKGAKCTFSVNLFNGSDDKINLKNSGFSVKWYKQSGSGFTQISTANSYVIKSVADSDFAEYKYEIYLGGRKILESDTFALEAKEKALSNSIKVEGKGYVTDGSVSGTLPAGITYDQSTSTLTLNNYNGTVSDSLVEASGDINIVISGNNIVNFNAESYNSSVLCSNGLMNITGSGTLNINVGKATTTTICLKAKNNLSISDATINIKSDKEGSYYNYGISLEPWANASKGYQGCRVLLNNCTINIDSKMPAGSEAANAGIDAQDADLVIINSKINMKLQDGTIFGLCCGLKSRDYEIFGGELSVDDKSEIIVDATSGDSEYCYAAYFYEDSINSKYVRTGSIAPGKARTHEDAFSIDYSSRFNVEDPYFELTQTAKADVEDEPAEKEHDYKVTKEAVAATCTTDGSTEVKTCANCGDVIGGEVIKATGHKYNKGKVTTAPTSAKTGVRTKTCTVCGDKKTESIAKIAKTSVSSLSSKTRGFTVKWSKKTAATGYQIMYSTSSKFKSGNKTATISKNSTVSKTVKSLKTKKKYYVKVRCYKVIDGKKYFGSWSTAKKVTTK